MDDNMDVDELLYAKLFARPPVYDLVFACLSPRSLIRVALTCRIARTAVAEFKIRAFNINRHFSRYFSDPIAFRSLQAKTNTLISGSNALQFLDRTFYPESDLDLYTHPGHSFEVTRFLVEAEGYLYVPRESQVKDWKEATKGDWDGTERRVILRPDADRAYPMTGVKGVWSFRKLGLNRERLKVQVIEASSSPLECVLGFHSTCVMNVISSDAAYAFYPMATFEKRCALAMPSARSSARAFEAIEKYVNRGWRVYFVPAPNTMAQSNRSPFFLGRTRRVCDRHTWVLPLDQTGIQRRPPLSPASPPLTVDPVVCNGWRFKRRTGEDDGYECDYHPLRTTLFRYNYAIGDEMLAFNMRAWARQQGLHSHGRIPKHDWVWFDADLAESFETMTG